MTTFELKCIALVLMVIDHIGLYFLSLPEPVYLLLRSLGRLSYPLFLFCMVQGYARTRSRRKYLLRLYLGSLFMTGFMLFVENCFPTEGGYGFHNIFLSMLLVGVVVSTVETFQADRKKGLEMAAGIFAVQVLYLLALPFAGRYVSGDILTGVIPNLARNEYGLDFVMLGALMYFLRDRRELFSAVYLLFCAAQFGLEADWGLPPIQWLMALALPLMLRYNGERGRSWKWFFYVFYPAHTFVLFYLSNYVLV